MKIFRDSAWVGYGLGLLAGLALGLLIPINALRDWSVLPWQAAKSDPTPTEPHTHGPSTVFDVSLAAQQTLGLRRGLPQRGDYQAYTSVPGVVREKPAISNLYAACKFSGIVRKIYVEIGQSVREGDRLFDLELTGEALAESQSQILEVTKQLEIVRAEILRLRPGSESGSIPRKTLLEKEYEEKRLLSLLETQRQELLIKGFSPQDLERILSTGRLQKNITICVPEGIVPTAERQNLQASLHERQLLAAHSPDDDWVYSIERLYVSPGAVTQAGEPLCDLAYHKILIVEGQAYERDLPILNELLQTGEPVALQFGSDDTPEPLLHRPILYIDNHLDPVSMVVRFYIQLDNEVASERRDLTSGALFRTWKYRPSQRGHVRLPQRLWKEILIVPADAVAKDGLDRVVFLHLGEHHPDDEEAHSEFQKLSVPVLYENREVALIDPSGKLGDDSEIALNDAHLLLMHMNKSEGGGHHHDH